MTDTYHLRMAHQVVARGIRPHYVYFMVATPLDKRDDVLVKVGTSTDVDRRLSQIRAACAAPVDLAGWIVADGETEKHLHKAFSQHAIGGEWFVLAPIRSAINDLLASYCVCRGCQIDGGFSAHL